MLVLFNSLTLLNNENSSHWFDKSISKHEDLRWVPLNAPLSFCLVFNALVLADGFAVFHGHLGLVGSHLFALSGIVEQKAPLWFNSASSGLLCLRTMNLSPFLDEFELHGLLLLHGGQELLEVFTLLCDVAVLYLLLLVAVAADEL